MYNRYVPQDDGSYRRDTIRQARQTEERIHYQNMQPQPNPVAGDEAKHEPPTKREGAGTFLKGLLPKDLDTGDLLIIILLLLLAGDNKDEKNSALLTLALYLFM